MAREQERRAASARREAARDEATRIRRVILRERLERANAKEVVRLQVEGDMQEAQALTKECEDRFAELKAVLANRLHRNVPVNINTVKKNFVAQSFSETPYRFDRPEPRLELPRPPGFFARMIPSLVQAYEIAANQARLGHQEELEEYRKEKDKYAARREIARLAHLAKVHAEEQEVLQFNVSLDKLSDDVQAGDKAAISEYLNLVIETGPVPEEFPNSCRVA